MWESELDQINRLEYIKGKEEDFFKNVTDIYGGVKKFSWRFIDGRFTVLKKQKILIQK